jgi:hypothetical protein
VAKYGFIRRISEKGTHAIFTRTEDIDDKLDRLFNAMVQQEANHRDNTDIFKIYLSNPDFLALTLLISSLRKTSTNPPVMSKCLTQFFAEYINDCSIYIFTSLFKIVKIHSDHKIARFFWNGVKELNFLDSKDDQLMHVIEILASMETKEYPNLMELLKPFSLFILELIQ